MILEVNIFVTAFTKLAFTNRSLCCEFCYKELRKKKQHQHCDNLI